jgi:hypothetical protein
MHIQTLSNHTRLISNLAIQHNSIILVLEPSDSIRLADLLVNTNLTSAMLAFGNSATWSCKDNIEVHYFVNNDNRLCILP